MKPGGVRTVARAIEILELLGDEPGLSVSEIARKMEIPKASAHEILTTLVVKRVVVKNESSGAYHLGPTLFVLGSIARSSLDIVMIAEEHLQALNAELDETVHLTALRNDRLLYVDCVESSRRLRTLSSIGEVAELYCTAVGKAVLAYQSPRRRSELLAGVQFRQFTPNTIVDPTALDDELAGIVERGYAIDNVEHEEGVRCIGAPVRDHTSQVVGSISLSGPSGRVTTDRDTAIAERVKATADRISAALGTVR